LGRGSYVPREETEKADPKHVLQVPVKKVKRQKPDMWSGDGTQKAGLVLGGEKQVSPYSEKKHGCGRPSHQRIYMNEGKEKVRPWDMTQRGRNGALSIRTTG